jgi:hypothetical protein
LGLLRYLLELPARNLSGSALFNASFNKRAVQPDLRSSEIGPGSTAAGSN